MQWGAREASPVCGGRGVTGRGGREGESMHTGPFGNTDLLVWQKEPLWVESVILIFIYLFIMSVQEELLV